MWSLHGGAANVSSSRPASRWWLESTLYHRRLLPPRFDKLPFHTPQPLTGQRESRGSVMPAVCCHTPSCLQRVGVCSSNSYVHALSVSKRILNSSQAAAQQNTVLKQCRTLMCARMWVREVFGLLIYSFGTRRIRINNIAASLLPSDLFN